MHPSFSFVQLKNIFDAYKVDSQSHRKPAFVMMKRYLLEVNMGWRDRDVGNVLALQTPGLEFNPYML